MAKQPLPNNKDLVQCLGVFQGTWAIWELITDYAVGHFLNVTDEQAHLITAGMMFGTKGRLLADLISRSDHPHKAKLLGPLNWIRGHALRDALAHSYQKLGEDGGITFVDRRAGGGFAVKEHEFTLKEFAMHVK